ncbi:MAG: archease [Candidatus Bipolaricaulota bacterium]
MSARIRQGFRYLDHTADLAVEAWAATADEVLAQAARAMFSAMLCLDAVRPLVSVNLSGQAPTLDDLLVEWLAGLLAEKDLSSLVFSRFVVTTRTVGPARLAYAGQAWGEPLNADRHRPSIEVKGISYLGLSVTQSAGVWTARYVADV